MKKTNPNSSSKDNSPSHEQYLYLTTRGRSTGLPREIEIWFTCHDARFYVIAEYPTSNWLKNLLAHPQARIRVAGANLGVHARLVSEPEVQRTIAELSQEKYGWGDGTVVELIPVSNRKP